MFQQFLLTKSHFHGLLSLYSLVYLPIYPEMPPKSRRSPTLILVVLFAYALMLQHDAPSPSKRTTYTVMLFCINM
jgi:hypothetical protein